MSKKSKQPLLQNPGVVGVLASLLSIVIGLVLGFILPAWTSLARYYIRQRR